MPMALNIVWAWSMSMWVFLMASGSMAGGAMSTGTISPRVLRYIGLLRKDQLVIVLGDGHQGVQHRLVGRREVSIWQIQIQVSPSFLGSNLARGRSWGSCTNQTFAVRLLAFMSSANLWMQLK